MTGYACRAIGEGEVLQECRHRMIPYLRASKERIPLKFNLDKMAAFEEQIVNIMETFKKRRLRPAAPCDPAAPGQPSTTQAR